MLNASIFRSSQELAFQITNINHQINNLDHHLIISKSVVAFTLSFLLLQRHQEISDLFEDFRDGIKLLALLEVLTSQILVSH